MVFALCLVDVKRPNMFRYFRKEQSHATTARNEQGAKGNTKTARPEQGVEAAKSTQGRSTKGRPTVAAENLLSKAMPKLKCVRR
jgi:hypothetical protein